MADFCYEYGPNEVAIDGVAVKFETDAAILVTLPAGEGEEWVPKSQLSEDSEVYMSGTDGTLVVKKWIAEQKGWV